MAVPKSHPFRVLVSLPHATVENLLDCMYHNECLSPEWAERDPVDEQPIQDTLYRGRVDEYEGQFFTMDRAWRLDDWFDLVDPLDELTRLIRRLEEGELKVAVA